MPVNLDHVINDDVRWEGSYRGYLPTVDDELLAGLDADDPDVVAALVEALEAPDRFVVAHVLLTRLSRLEYSTFPEWNGLELSIDADGDVTVAPEQRAELARRWALWQDADPRPSRLPA